MTPNIPPYTRTTILFPVRGNEVLLGMKKRGLGVGWWNGFGGKLEPGESYAHAAIRETQEECGLVPLTPQCVAQLEFYFDGTLGVVSHAYVARQFSGTPIETNEMQPKWFVREALPLELMWPGDREWVPRALVSQGQEIIGMRLFYRADHSLMSCQEISAEELSL